MYYKYATLSSTTEISLDLCTSTNSSVVYQAKSKKKIQGGLFCQLLG
jgi:hypothetical protein